MRKAKASIFCLTYNHAPYIREALDGFLMQKTDFDFNIFIYDDASTDGTSDIVREYQKKYPNIIQAYISPVNLYRKPERRRIVRALYDQYLTGEYIAVCEGDDAWTCEDKLQIQVDFLENNANCMMTAHAAKWINYAENTVTSKHLCAENRYMLPEEVILRRFWSIPTASTVMRRDVFFLEDAFPRSDIGDVPRMLYAICHGGVYYFDKEMSIYRFMHEGSWNKRQADNPENIARHGLCYVDFLMRYNAYSKQKFEKPSWQLAVAWLYRTVDMLLGADNVTTFIQNISERNSHKYDSLIEEIIPVYKWMSGNYQMDDQMREMTAQYEHICIMGKGNYSKFIVNSLEKNEIRYDGYLLSKKEEGCEDPNVWDVLDFPYNKEATLVVVGISQMQEDAITETLKEHGFKNVWHPLWFDKERVWG